MNFFTKTIFSIFLFTIGMSTISFANVQVTIEKIKNTKGQILILLFDSEQGFPNSDHNAVRKFVFTPDCDRVSFDISDLPVGKYAISFIHDMNGNGSLDTNLLGIPKEGFGFSKDAIGVFGPPSFADAKFELKEGDNTISMRMRYL